MNRKLMVLFGVLLAALAAVIIILCCTVRGSASPSKDTKETPVFASVEVQADESLWSISERYAASYHCEVRDYIKELKRINNLQSDRINEGMHLIVVTY